MCKTMRKGPLIAAGIEGIIGLAMVIVGSIFYDINNPTTWAAWVLWLGIVVFGIALIILVIAFIKKPGETEEAEETQ